MHSVIENAKQQQLSSDMCMERMQIRIDLKIMQLSDDLYRIRFSVLPDLSEFFQPLTEYHLQLHD